jgi:hypothetical protein
MNAKRTATRPDEVNSLGILLHEIDRMNVSDAARMQFLHLLRRMAGHTIRLNRCILTKPQNVRLAMRLLDDGMTVSQARSVLVVRTGVSKSTAYNLIGAALTQRFEDRKAGLLADTYGETDHHG